MPTLHHSPNRIVPGVTPVFYNANWRKIVATDKTPQGRAERLLKLLRNRIPIRHRYQWTDPNCADIFLEYKELADRLDKVKTEVEEKVEAYREKLERENGVTLLKSNLERLAEQIDERLKKARSTLDQVSIKVTAGKDLEKQIEIMMKVAVDLNLVNGE